MNIFRSLFIVFLVIPILEIFLLIKVGGIIGAVPTVLAIIATAGIGAFLIRHQGITTLNRVQTSLQNGEIPAIEMFEGLVLLISGALLLTPGFFTDSIGFIALIPGLRRLLIVWALKHASIIQTIKQSQNTYESQEFYQHTTRKNIVIEGECEKDNK
ncbi:MAG TPA: FxsA family protein [Gammaproteobacteria bacterium]|nr:FxsA family protein [Gammaproteobacteria bacterium]